MTLPLDGRVILVTGAAKRIGRGIALHLAKHGARVAIHYSTSEAEARTTAAEANNVSPYKDTPIFPANLERVSEIESLFERVHAHFGRIDGLVNNAARFTQIDPLKVTEADWDFIHSVNLKATFFCCQQAARLMLAAPTGGRIVNISSLGGLHPWATHSHYCASKAGVVMLTKALAKAFAPKVTVNSVAPGVIPFSEHDDRITRLIAATPAGRAGTAEEIAEAVAFFLTSPDFITGQLCPSTAGWD